MRPVSPIRVAIEFGLDIGSVLLFVVVGLNNHSEPKTLANVFQTALPFMIATAISWLACRAWRKPHRITTGVKVWFLTTTLGLLLRNSVYHRGTAISFIIVTSLVLGLLQVGRRFL